MTDKEIISTKTDSIEAAAAPRPPRQWTAVFSLLIAAGASLLVLYVLALNNKASKTLAGQNQRLSASILQLKAEQATLQTALTDLEKKRTEADENLASKMAAINQQLAATLKQSQYDNEDWLLLKVRYYLELAEINAQWSHDTAASIALYTQADKLLEPFKEKQALALRAVIIEEINQLKTAPKLDLSGWLSQIAALNQLIDALPLSNQTKAAKTASETTNPDDPAWKSHLAVSIKALEKLVIVRKINPEHPVLPPLYSAIIRENIKLNLEQAQWAALNGNEEIYRLSLKQALTNVQQYFDSSDAKTIEVVKQLQGLNAIHIKAEQPDFNKALPLLNQWIDNLQSQKAPQPQKGASS